MRKGLVLITVLLLGSLCLQAQKSLLQSGPMLGYNEFREVMLWVQTNDAATVKINYYPQDNASKRQSTRPVLTKREDGYTAHLLADQVEPGTSYIYELIINDQKIELPYKTTFTTQPLWQHRTDPPSFKVALGSCLYISEEKYDRPGKAYGGDYQIINHIHEKKPDLMLWMGDNTYYREADWTSKTGMIYRNTHTRSLPELQPFLANTHHYAIWDDHDYGSNDSDGSFIHKEKSLEVFKDFWANPTYGFYDYDANVTQFQYGDAEFFMLDNRFFRDMYYSKRSGKSMFGQKQIDWLLLALSNSKATFKFVVAGGQILNTTKVFETYAQYEKERQYLLDQLQYSWAKGVIFLSGDRHHTVLTKLDREDKYPLYDLTVSPLTSKAYQPKDSERTGGMDTTTIVAERNYGLLSFSGSKNDRILQIDIYNAQDELQWRKQISAKELK